MEESLRRKVLTTTGRNVTADLNYNSGRPPRKSLDGDYYNHDDYLNSIVSGWKGEPEELFDRGNWIKWIRREAKRREVPEAATLDDKSLKLLASSLMDSIFNENKPKFDGLRKKFSPDKEKRFQKLKRRYDDEENRKLLDMARGNTPDSDSSDSYSKSDSDEDNVRKSNDASVFEVVLTQPIFRSPSPSSDEDQEERKFGGGLFKNLRLHSQGGYKKTAPTPFKKGQPDPPRINKRSASEPKKDVVSRKKPRTNERYVHPYPPLNIKRIPTYKVTTKCFQSAPRPSPSPSTARGLTETVIMDMLNDPSNYKREEADIYENCTPPYSPGSSSSYNRQSEGSASRRSFESRTTSNRDRRYSNNPKSRVTSHQSFQSRIIDKYSERNNSGGAEKENCRRENQRIFGNHSSRNESLTQTNKKRKSETWDDNFPDNERPVVQDEKENLPVSVEEILAHYPKPPSAPPLTLEMFEEIKKTLEKPPKEKVVSGFALNILQEDLVIISKDTEWLIDLNIDFYLELIKNRSQGREYPSVYIFHSFFYTLLTEAKAGGYEVVRDTTGDDLLFIPVNRNEHWRLAVVKVAEKVIECYDSMNHNNHTVLQNIEDFLLRWEDLHVKQKEGEETTEDEPTNNTEPELTKVHEPADNQIETEGTKEDEPADTTETEGNNEDKPTDETERTKEDEPAHKITLICPPEQDNPDPVEDDPNPLQWTKRNVPGDTIPQQTNAIDCGIFALQFAEYLSRHQKFDFNQSHIPYFRKRMMYETLTKKLLTSRYLEL